MTKLTFVDGTGEHEVSSTNPLPVTGGGGGGGGAVTVADGADVAQGTTTDAAVTNPASAGTVLAFLKGLVSLISGRLPAALVGGRLDVNVGAALPAGNNNIGDVDVATLPALVAGTALIGAVKLRPDTANGLSIGRVLSAASTNATSVKGTAGQVYGWFISNTNAAARYVKLYNKATAPTVGTDTPVMTLMIPPGGAANVGLDMGVAFSTGIALAITTGAADSDTGAVAANEIIVNLLYA